MARGACSEHVADWGSKRQQGSIAKDWLRGSEMLQTVPGRTGAGGPIVRHK